MYGNIFQVPLVPQVPQVPQVPTVPTVPRVPSVPYVPNIGNLGTFNNNVNELINLNSYDTKQYVNPYDDPSRYRSLADVIANRKLIHQDSGLINVLEDAGDWFSDNVIRNIPFVGGMLEDIIDGSVDTVQDVYDDIKSIPYLGDVVSFYEDYVVRWNTGAIQRLYNYADQNYIHPTEGTNPFLNALNALGKDLDFFTGANLIKSIVIPLTQGDINIFDNVTKGLGWSKEGLHHYNWDTGVWLFDLGLEILSDPTNWITFGGKSLVIDPLAKLGTSSIDDVAKAIAKEGFGLSDEAAEAFIKTLPDAVYKDKTITKMLAKDIAEEGLEAAYVKYYRQVLSEMIKNAPEELLMQSANLRTLRLGLTSSDDLIRESYELYMSIQADKLTRSFMKNSVVSNKLYKTLLGPDVDAFKIVENTNKLMKGTETLNKVIVRSNPLGLAGVVAKNTVGTKAYTWLSNKVKAWKLRGVDKIDEAVYREFYDYTDAAYKYKDGLLIKAPTQEYVVRAADSEVQRYMLGLPKEWIAKGINTERLYKAFEKALYKTMLSPGYQLNLIDTNKTIYTNFIHELKTTFDLTIDPFEEEMLLDYLTKETLPLGLKNQKIISTAKALKNIVKMLEAVTTVVGEETQQTKLNITTNFNALRKELNKCPDNYTRLKKIRNTFFKYKKAQAGETGQIKYHKLQNYRRILRNANPDAAEYAIEEFENLIEDMGLNIKDLSRYDTLLDLSMKDQDKVYSYYKAISTAIGDNAATIEEKAKTHYLDNKIKRYARDSQKLVFKNLFVPNTIPGSTIILNNIKPLNFVYDLSVIDESLNNIPDNILRKTNKTIVNRKVRINTDLMQIDPNLAVRTKKLFVETLKERTDIISNINKQVEPFFKGLDEQYIRTLIPTLKEYYYSINTSINKHVSDNLDVIDAFEKVFIDDMYEGLYLNKKFDTTKVSQIERTIEEFNIVISEIYNNALDNMDALAYIDYIKELYDFSRLLNQLDLGTEFTEVLETDDIIYALMLTIQDNYRYYVSTIFNNTELNKAITNILNPNSYIRTGLEELTKYLGSNEHISSTSHIAENIRGVINKTQGAYNYMELLNELEEHYKPKKASNNYNKFATIAKNELTNQILTGDFSSVPASMLDNFAVETIMNNIRNMFYYNGYIRKNALAVVGIKIDKFSESEIESILIETRKVLEKYIKKQTKCMQPLFSFFDSDTIKMINDLEIEYENVYDMLFNDLQNEQLTIDTLSAFRKFLNIFTAHDGTFTQHADAIISALNNDIIIEEELFENMKSDTLIRTFIDASNSIKKKNDEILQHWGYVEKGALSKFYGDPYTINALYGVGTKTINDPSSKFFGDSFVKAMRVPTIIYRQMQDNYNHLYKKHCKNFIYKAENELAFKLGLMQKIEDPVFREAINNGIDAGVLQTKKIILDTPQEELRSWFYAIKGSKSVSKIVQLTPEQALEGRLDVALDMFTHETLDKIDDEAVMRMRTKLLVLYNNIDFVKFITADSSIFNLMTDNTLSQTNLQAVAKVLKITDADAVTNFIQHMNRLGVRKGMSAVRKEVFRKYISNLSKEQLLAAYTWAYNIEEYYEIIKKSFKEELATGKAADEVVVPRLDYGKTMDTVQELTEAGFYHLALASCKENLFTEHVFTNDVSVLNERIAYKDFINTIFDNKYIDSIITETEYDKLLGSKELLDVAHSNKVAINKIDNIITTLEEYDNNKDFRTNKKVVDEYLRYVLKHRLNIITSLDVDSLQKFITGPNLGLIRIQADSFKIPWTKEELNKVGLDVIIKDNTTYIFNTNPDVSKIFNNTQNYAKFSDRKSRYALKLKDDLTFFYNSIMPYTNIINNPFELDFFLLKTIEQSDSRTYLKELEELGIQKVYLNPAFFENGMARMDYVNFQEPSYFGAENYGVNLKSLITYNGASLIRRADNSLRYIDEMFTQECLFPSTFAAILCRDELDDATVKQIIDTLDYTGLVIKTHHPKDGVVKLTTQIYPIESKEAILNLCNMTNNSVIVPKAMVYNIEQAINNSAYDDNGIKLLKLYSNTLKTGMLASPGMVARNFLDIITKNIIVTKLDPISQLPYYQLALEMFQDYNYVYNKAIEIFGQQGLSNDFLEAALEVVAEERHYTELARKDFYARMNIMHALINEGAMDSNIEVLEKMQREYNLRTKSGLDKFIQDYYNVLRNLPYVNPINKMNSLAESIGRITLALIRLQETGSLETALQDVIKTHFRYGGKNELAKYAELIIPFLTFPIKNFVFWMDEGMAYPLILKLLLHATRSSWSDESGSFGKTITVSKDGTLKSDPYKVIGVQNGGLSLGDYMFKTGNSFFDALSLVMDPMGELNNRLTPALRYVLSGGKDTYSGLTSLPFGSQLYRINHSIKELKKGKAGLQTLFPTFITKPTANWYSLATVNAKNRTPRLYYSYPKSNRNPIRYGNYPKVSYKAMHGSNRSVAFKRFYGKVKPPAEIYKKLYPKNKYAIVNLKKWQAQNPSYYYGNAKNIVSNVNRIKAMFR